jgi:hypothetical protein
MAIYQDTDLADVIENTQSYFERRKWVDLSHTNQDYVITSRIFQGARFGVDGGLDLRWKVQTSNTSSYTPVGVGPIVNPAHADHTDGAAVQWAAAVVTSAWFEEETDWQSSPEKIIDVLAVKQNAMNSDITVGMENALWSSPSSSSQNPRVPYGIPAWVQKAGSTTAAFSFGGGDPSWLTTGLAGIDSDTVTAWKNGNFGYSAITQADLLPKLSEAMEKSYFKPPRAYPELVDAKPNFVLYTTYPVWEAFQSLQTVSNDNLGTDVGKFRSTVMFKGVPMTWVPALTNSSSPVRDTQNPIYGIDWSVLKLFFKKGYDWKTFGPVSPDNQPTVQMLTKLAWYNFRCLSRRQLFVGHTTVFGQ